MSIDISVNKNNKIGRASTRSLYKQKADIPGLSDNLLPVICKTPRVTYASQIRVGEKYYIDRTTLYIDRDGDAYAIIPEKEEDGAPLFVWCSDFTMKIGTKLIEGSW